MKSSTPTIPKRPKTAPVKYRAVPEGPSSVADIERRADGAILLRSRAVLGPYPSRLTDRLEHWAAATPDRPFAAIRNRGGSAGDAPWRCISYAEMLARVQSVGESLVQRGLSADRPLAILSDNDLEHLTLTLAGQWVGVPVVPVSTAYSLVSKDFAKLRHVIDQTTPGLVFAASPAYARAIAATVPAKVGVVMTQTAVGAPELADRPVTSFEDLLGQVPSEAGIAAHAAVGLDTVAKILFTSGSTHNPKGVTTTQRMLCSNQQMVLQGHPFFADEPPVLMDWLPWSHTFGGNHNVGLVLYNGGTLYIDEGRPTPAGIAETLRNLRDISPTIYFNVPKGFEEIVRAMDHDAGLRQSLFRRVRAFKFAGAGLAQAIWDRLDAHAENTVGERICMSTGLGMTETSPSSTFALGPQVRASDVGIPCPGVEAKLVPVDGKLEIRFRGPHVTPGYWRQPTLTAEVFDDEGFYRTGDAVTFTDPDAPQRGLRFDGRLAEDFKLSTGTFVSVGPLRAKVIALGAPCVQDAVLTGLNRDSVGLLVFPRLDECRKLAQLKPDADARAVLRNPSVRAFFQILADRLWADGTGSANRVARTLVLEAQPSIDSGEITDKGSINQRAVLSRRSELVEHLYDPRSEPGANSTDEIFTPRIS